MIAHSEPDILLVDEALSVGDVGFQRKCEQAIRDFLARGTTMLLVSHDLASIERICHRVVWLEGGRIRDQGPVGDVLDSYRRFQQSEA